MAGEHSGSGGPIDNYDAGVRVTPAERKERKNMKTTKLALVASMALALTVGGLSAIASEKGSARGGAGDLIKQVAPKSATAAAIVMECPMCKSEWVVRTDSGARGVTKPTFLAERHLCGKCSTELKLVGTGKQATNIPVHLCKACTK
jgi:hypothetical protein